MWQHQGFSQLWANVVHRSEASALLKGFLRRNYFYIKSNLEIMNKNVKGVFFKIEHELMLCLRLAIWGTAPRLPRRCFFSLLCYLGYFSGNLGKTAKTSLNWD